MINLSGLATAIGSLPQQDVEQALDLVFKFCPEIPFWPQLPKRDNREGMGRQFTEGLPEDKSLETFYEKIISQDLDYFKISQDYAAGLYAFKARLQNRPELLKNIAFLKCHITGPFTLCAGINDENGVAYLHNPILMQAFIKGLAMKALWQIEFLKEFNKPIIIFVDEPYLGCFGSAFTPLNREDVVKGLGELTQEIKSEKVSVGVHCCGNTDWSIFTEIKSIDMINFDAFGFLEKFTLYADNLKEFIARGGVICWGIVPTLEFGGKETADSLAQKIKSGIAILEKKGLDASLLKERMLLSPSCGLGALDAPKAEQILKLLSETSLFIRKSG